MVWYNTIFARSQTGKFFADLAHLQYIYTAQLTNHLFHNTLKLFLSVKHVPRHLYSVRYSVIYIHVSIFTQVFTTKVYKRMLLLLKTAGDLVDNFGKELQEATCILIRANS